MTPRRPSVLFGAIRALRIPLEYLAELFTAGDIDEIERVLTVLAAMRAHMRNITLEQPQDDSIAASVGMTDQSIREMYRLMAIAKYDERYVIPKAHVEQAHELEELGCSLDFDGGPYESGPFGEASGRPSPVAVETFQALQQRQTSERHRVRRSTPRPGEHAQLGRQRDTRGLVPDSRRSRRENPSPRGDPGSSPGGGGLPWLSRAGSPCNHGFAARGPG